MSKDLLEGKNISWRIKMLKGLLEGKNIKEMDQVTEAKGTDLLKDIISSFKTIVDTLNDVESKSAAYVDYGDKILGNLPILKNMYILSQNLTPILSDILKVSKKLKMR